MRTLALDLSNPVVINGGPTSAIYADARDVYRDLTGVITRRPALPLFCQLGTSKPIDGVYWWQARGILIAVSDGRTFKITDQFGAKSEITGDRLLIRRPPTFATDGTNLLMANGARIVQTNGTTNTTYLADVDAPTVCTHVDWLDTFFLANNRGSDKWNFSKSADYTDWNPLDFEVAMTNPDEVVALKVADREINLAGSKTWESWYLSANGTFERNDAACMEAGCVAPYSLARVGNTFIWLDERRQVVIREGRSAKAVTPTYGRIIDSFNVVSDAIGMSFTYHGQVIYLLQFPTEGRCFAYNVSRQEWEGEWCRWDSQHGEYENYAGQCYTFCDAWGLHVVGSRIDDSIYFMDDDQYADYAGTIRSLKQTLPEPFGTSETKWGHELVLHIQRGSASVNASASPMLQVRWKSDGRLWSPEKQINLGLLGDTDNIIRLRSPGRFRNRQFEFVLSDQAAFQIVKAEMVVEIVG